MQEISALRSQIDEIHRDLVALFQKRLSLAEQVWKHKQVHQLPFFDGTREDEIIHAFDEHCQTDAEKTAVQNFLKSILLESRRVLEEKLK